MEVSKSLYIITGEPMNARIMEYSCRDRLAILTDVAARCV